MRAFEDFPGVPVCLIPLEISAAFQQQGSLGDAGDRLHHVPPPGPEPMTIASSRAMDIGSSLSVEVVKH
jgi:hypothetical protein